MWFTLFSLDKSSQSRPRLTESFVQLVGPGSMALPDGILAADQDDGPSKLFFCYREHVTRALVATAASTGALICIPKAGLPEEIFTEAQEASFPEEIEPFTHTTVAASTSQGRPSRRTLDVILFDLDLAGFDSLVLDAPDGVREELIVTFGSYRGAVDWPHIPSLLEAAGRFIQAGGDRLEAYFSALEDGQEELSREEGANIEDMLKKLLVQSEGTQRAVSGLRQRLETLEQSQAAPPLQAPPRGAAAPQMFQPSATLDQNRMERLQALAGRGPSRSSDLGAQPKSHAHPVQKSPGVGGITEVDEVESEEELPAMAAGTVLEQLLTSQTQLLQKLALAKSAQQDPLVSLGSGTSAEGEDTGKLSGVKGIAARQLLMDSFRKHPKKVIKIFRDRLALARRKGSAHELEPRDLWLHMQETVPLGTHRTLTYVAFQSAAMFEAMERQDWDRLCMLVTMQSIFAEQAAYDGGSLRLAHLLTCLEDPPFAQTELHRVPKTDFAHGQLSDPRWLASQLAYLKDVESITEKSSRYTKGSPSSAHPQSEDLLEESRAKPKWKNKRRKGGPQEQSGGIEN